MTEEERKMEEEKSRFANRVCSYTYSAFDVIDFGKYCMDFAEDTGNFYKSQRQLFYEWVEKKEKERERYLEIWDILHKRMLGNGSALPRGVNLDR